MRGDGGENAAPKHEPFHHLSVAGQFVGRWIVQEVFVFERVHEFEPAAPLSGGAGELGAVHEAVEQRIGVYVSVERQRKRCGIHAAKMPEKKGVLKAFSPLKKRPSNPVAPTTLSLGKLKATRPAPVAPDQVAQALANAGQALIAAANALLGKGFAPVASLSHVHGRLYDDRE